MAGVTADKVRFHNLARWYATEAELAAALPGGNEEALHLVGTSPDYQTEVPSTGLDLDYEALEFSANRVRFRVPDVPEEGVWMAYSDVWHPFWRATVNGVEVPVHRADLAYKAVRLVPGTNDVVFRMSNPLLTVAVRGMQTLALGFVLAVMIYLLWLFWIGALFFRLKLTIDHGEAT
jgi:hypothetical protein